ncbi:unnamed protein product [Thlaspi arvense]|uniref:E3 ubiquitin-protein ligase Sina-like RING finger domain-containing protein n=1 Tax=Thlaspi arvense TaxID=13288 RepID=A0AAU9TAU4_THLAR|nr:unnamed protein product [Thlaspi arvense]
MVGASILEEGNGSTSVLTKKRRLRITFHFPGEGAKRVGTEAKKLSTMMLDPVVLDCPICFEALKIPIFQCDNGHLACSSCCPKLSGKCPACALPIGHIRCRAMESVLESICVPCPNAKHGCTKNLTYGKESIHEKECIFSQCSCPAPDCDYTGLYTRLYFHYIYSNHQMRYMGTSLFSCGESFTAKFNIRDKILVKEECRMTLLFAVQCFREPYGVYVTVSCIAPSAPRLGKFSYDISYTVDGHTMIYKSLEMKRVLEVSFETPKENFMLIPHSSLRGELLKMELCIKKLEE